MERLPICPELAVDPEKVIVLLRSMPLMQQVPEATLRQILAAVRPVRFGPGESIVQFGGEGAGLYIIWKGEAKVLSPPNEDPHSHTESLLTSGDYFGTATAGPLRRVYKADVVAISEVFALVLTHENANLLSTCSVWDWKYHFQGPYTTDRLMQLETIGVDLFQSLIPVPVRSSIGRTFGGVFVGQGLLAATKTVNPALLVYSLHCYFLRTGDQDYPIVYQVERTFQGQSFATRHVEATQKGKVIFVLYASFKVEMKGLEYSDPMPNVPGPEELQSWEQSYDSYLTDPRLSLADKQKYGGVKLPLYPIERRPLDITSRLQPVRIDPLQILEPRQMVWFRCRDKLAGDQSFHRSVAAYATDFDILDTCLRAGPYTRARVLSLDHTIRFHGSFEADEWLLYVMESPIAVDGRGFVLGKIYTQKGKLVMSVAQDGLLQNTGGDVAIFAKL